MLRRCSNLSSKEFNIFIEEALKYGELFRNPLKLAKKVKEIALRKIGSADVKVYIFGSTIKGKYTAMSDIDILIVVSENLDKRVREELKAEIAYNIDAPLEIHIVSEREFKEWYKKFIGNNELLEAL